MGDEIGDASIMEIFHSDVKPINPLDCPEDWQRIEEVETTANILRDRSLFSGAPRSLSVAPPPPTAKEDDHVSRRAAIGMPAFTPIIGRIKCRPLLSRKRTSTLHRRKVIGEILDDEIVYETDFE